MIAAIVAMPGRLFGLTEDLGDIQRRISHSKKRHHDQNKSIVSPPGRRSKRGGDTIAATTSGVDSR